LARTKGIVPSPRTGTELVALARAKRLSCGFSAAHVRAAPGPRVRARLSSVSPRSSRKIASVFRRTEKRPGSRPLFAGPDGAALARDFLSLLRFAMSTSLAEHHAPQ
jgi:hypothetical protein